MTRRSRIIITLAVILAAALMLSCATVDRSRAWADAEATRQAWDAEHYFWAGD